MKDQMDEIDLDLDSVDTDSALRAVIVYDDPEAGKRAVRMMADIGKRLGETIDFEPLPWSLDFGADANWRDIAASDAVDADILIIASSNFSPLPQAVGRWGQAATARRCGSSAAIVALFGPVENADRPGPARLEVIRTAAQRAGLGCFAPALGQEPDEAIARVEGRYAMVTSGINKNLHQDHPAPRWGINE